jgi:hypothetical protein
LQVIAQGALTGLASPRFPFWPGIDLAVATVKRDATAHCKASLTDLKPGRQALRPSGEGVLVLVNQEGHVERLSMRLTKVGYLTFDAVFIDAARQQSAMQGMSGGFLFVGDKPVGMALNAVEDGSVRFMRVEEIHLNLNRWLGTQGEATFTKSSDAKPEPAKTGHKLSVLSSTVTATRPETVADNMLFESGAFVFQPKSSVQIDLQVGEADTKTTVSRVRMRSDPDQGHTLPRRIVVLINSAPDGGRWRSFWSGEMPRSGVLDTGPVAPSWAKRVRIIIASAWEAGPVRIDHVAVE